MVIILKNKIDKAKKASENSKKKTRDKVNKNNRKKRKAARTKRNAEKSRKLYYEKLKKERAKIPKPTDHKAYYRIIITTQKKILGDVYSCMSKNRAVIVYNKIIETNKNSVRFPIAYSSRDRRLLPYKNEILLMKTKEPHDDDFSVFRDEYGRLIKHVANSDKMIIYKKEPYLIEEKFWVYGFHPKEQRKTFYEILETIILKDVNTKLKYLQKRILVYRNKLIIEDEYGDIDIVICKCKEDCVRLYFELEKELSKMKIKSIFFSGSPARSTKRTIINKIREKTGWNDTKIYRDSTRP